MANRLRVTPAASQRALGSVAASVAFASPARIDRDNILRASLWALARAVHALPEPPKHVFVDGRDRLDTQCDCDAVIGGDGLVLSIAAASIIAKVTRDRLMEKLAGRYPGYGWEHNCGYPTIDHRKALRELGVTPFHRQDFGTVKIMLLGEQLELDVATA